MMSADPLLVRFLLASAACMAAGVAAWALSRLLLRVPGQQRQRSTWLLAQLMVVAVFVVLLWPDSEQLRLVPPIEVDGETVTAAASTSTATPGSVTVTQTVAPAPTVTTPSWLVLGARAWFVAYLLGLAFALRQLWRARRLLHGLAHAGAPLTSHPAFADTVPAHGLEVIEVDAPISPMLFGLLRPRLLLPRHLRQFDGLQQQLMVEHELTHLQRRDVHWMSAGLLLQTLLWFNPVMRLLQAQLTWAQELGCDHAVLGRHPRLHRKAYAAALVAQLKTQHRPIGAALAFGGVNSQTVHLLQVEKVVFGGVNSQTVAARIAMIRDPANMARSRTMRLLGLAGLASIFAAALVLQPAFAWRGEDAALQAQAINCTLIADAGSGQRLVQEGTCDQAVTPASTFNIPVSLMGFDSGILVDEHTPSLPFKAGYADWNPAWHATTDPTRWLKASVVWYAQQVTAKLGADRFQRYVSQFDYGNQDLSGDPGMNNGLSMSWIGSSLKISPVGQIAFLRKIVNRQLGLSAHAHDMTDRIMVTDSLPNGWVVRGKTGTGNARLPNGQEDDTHQVGWFVGWASKGDRTIVFAKLVHVPHEDARAAGPRAKAAFMAELPHMLAPP